ncbi:MAG: penicillin-insensitive murein endopeptidase [Bacteroidota bacterium]
MHRRYWRHPFPYLMALLVSLLYFSLPVIVRWSLQQPYWQNYAYQNPRVVVNVLQKTLLYPVGQFLHFEQRALLIFPYWVFWFLACRVVYLHTQRYCKFALKLSLGILLLLWLFPNLLLYFETAQPSQSMGHVNNGQIQHSKRMPYQGSNFRLYSFGAYLLGRTFVHERVRQIVLDSYQACAKTCPETQFVLGELGHRRGGVFLPHFAHQNGLSVDFMVPLLKEGQPTTNHQFWNLWGYDTRFDEQGQGGVWQIDFHSMRQQLIALDQAAKANGMVIQKIVFHPDLLPLLWSTEIGSALQQLPFSQQKEAIRHDNHYHVDFGFKQ